MSKAGDVLRRAAADVEVRGVTHFPDRASGKTCAVIAVKDAAWALRPCLRDHDEYDGFKALEAVAGTFHLADWNDAQPSRAVVAAEMRSAADLADLLYG